MHATTWTHTCTCMGYFVCVCLGVDDLRAQKWQWNCSGNWPSRQKNADMTLSLYVYNVAVGGKIPLDNYHVLSGKVKAYLFFLWWAFSAPTLWNTLQLFHSSLSRLSVPPRRISSKTHPITHGENGMRTMEPLYKGTPKMRTLVLIRTQCPSYIYIHACMYVCTYM